LIENTNHRGIFSLSTDLKSKAYVKTDDEEVSTDEGKNGSKPHSDCKELISLSPPKIDDDYGAIDELNDSGESNMFEDILSLLFTICYHLLSHDKLHNHTIRILFNIFEFSINNYKKQVDPYKLLPVIIQLFTEVKKIQGNHVFRSTKSLLFLRLNFDSLLLLELEIDPMPQ